MELASQDAELKAALFRFVDVVPACRSLDDLARHLTGFLGEVEEPPPPVAVAMRMGNTRAGRAALGAAAAAGVKHMAHRFIVGETPEGRAGHAARRCGSDGVASSVDLLGEATVTQAEAQRYAERCDDALDTLADAARDWPERPALERDGAGALPRANLSVKVSALTPLLRPDAPERGKRDAADRLRGLLRRARDARRAPAHRHGVAGLARRGARAGARAARRAGVPRRPVGRHGAAGLPARLARRRSTPCWTGPRAPAPRRAHPLTVRLVKGAYWDHEIVEAAQHGWNAPVFEVKADSDRNFEQLTRRLLDARPALRVAIASHNLRSVAHAIAYDQLLRRRAGATSSCRCCAGSATRCSTRSPRTGCACAPTARSATSSPAWPTSCAGCWRTRRNDSFLADQAKGIPLEELLAPPAAPRRMTPTPPFANEPVLELRRAPVRAQLADALRAHDERGPLDVPVWVGDGHAHGRRARLDRPRRAGPRGRARRGRDRRQTSTPRCDAARSGHRDWGRPARRGARRGAARAPPRGCASTGSRSPRWRCASAPSRGPRPTATSARRSTSSSTTRAARSSSRPAPSCCRSRASATR